ncbi:MAG: hypothetical protein LCI02_14900 [Proteobacteria bacterium]|nr:hypothetical protein [Pseudomonadota bacterium]
MRPYPRGFKPLLLTVMSVLMASGLALAPTTLALRAGWALPWRAGGGARLALVALHAAAGFALLLFLGALWAVHMRSGWRSRRQRFSGALLGGGALLLALSALGVYYLGDEQAAAVAGLGHLLLGLLALPLFLWHWLRGRRHRHRPRRRRAHPP